MKLSNILNEGKQILQQPMSKFEIVTTNNVIGNYQYVEPLNNIYIKQPIFNTLISMYNLLHSVGAKGVKLNI